MCLWSARGPTRGDVNRTSLIFEGSRGTHRKNMDAAQQVCIHGNHVVMENAASPGPLESQNLKDLLTY